MRAADEYLQNYLHDFVNIENGCLRHGVIAREAANYEQLGVEAVDFHALAKKLSILSKCRLAKLLSKIETLCLDHSKRVMALHESMPAQMRLVQKHLKQKAVLPESPVVVPQAQMRLVHPKQKAIVPESPVVVPQAPECLPQKRPWEMTAGEYFRKSLQKLAVIEQNCLAKSGVIARELRQFERKGPKGIDLVALRDQMAIVSRSQLAQQWNEKDKAIWQRHMAQVTSYIAKKSTPQGKARRPLPPKRVAPERVASERVAPEPIVETPSGDRDQKGKGPVVRWLLALVRIISKFRFK